MAESIDVYRKWLGITEPTRPLNHYLLLRLKLFEDDQAKVRQHYREMNAHVRKFASGEYAAQSQALLNELAKAMLCLTDIQRKAEYDATLGRTTKARAGGSMEELLLARGLIDPASLEKARRLAATVGLEVRDALVQQKVCEPESIMQAYAEANGFPFVDLNDLLIDQALVTQVPPVFARQHSFVPILADESRVMVASPNPVEQEVEDRLRLIFGKGVRTVLCTVSQMNEAIGKYYSRNAAVAEMAAKSSPTAAASAQATSAPVDPVAAAKKRNMVTLMSFNFSFMAVVIGMSLFTNTTLTQKLGLGAGAGLIGAIIGFFASRR